jgi:hypothetical protein
VGTAAASVVTLENTNRQRATGWNICTPIRRSPWLWPVVSVNAAGPEGRPRERQSSGTPGPDEHKHVNTDESTDPAQGSTTEASPLAPKPLRQFPDAKLRPGDDLPLDLATWTRIIQKLPSSDGPNVITGIPIKISGVVVKRQSFFVWLEGGRMIGWMPIEDLPVGGLRRGDWWVWSDGAVMQVGRRYPEDAAGVLAESPRLDERNVERRASSGIELNRDIEAFMARGHSLQESISLNRHVHKDLLVQMVQATFAVFSAWAGMAAGEADLEALGDALGRRLGATTSSTPKGPEQPHAPAERSSLASSDRGVPHERHAANGGQKVTEEKKPGAGPQKTRDLDQLYQEASVAQAALADVTNAIAQECGGRAMIPSSLKGRQRAMEKIDADYGGDASRLTDLARATIVFDRADQVVSASRLLRERCKVLRMKDRFQQPADGYRDMLFNVEMPNGHVCELQLHLDAIQRVKSGAGHKLYEQIRAIEARVKVERRDFTPEETKHVMDLKEQMKNAYDAAYAQSGGAV